MIIFPKDTIKIYHETLDSAKCGEDPYGKPRKCLTLKFTVQGDLQNISPSESRHGFGTKTMNTHNLYLNSDVQVKSTDIIKVEGYDGYFEIIGQPMVYNNLMPHILVLLRHIPQEVS